MRGRPLVVLALASLGAPACATGQGGTPATAAASLTRADTGLLRRTLDSLATRHRGVVGYTVHDLDTGERLERRGDETFPTASLIKVAILVTVFDLVEQKRLSLDDPLTVLRIDKVPGAGQLQFLHDNATISVRDAAWLMTTISDNTATNLLLDRIIIRRVWDKMEALGLSHTKVHSKSFLRNSSVAMDSSVKYGLGVTTPNEMARLFALLSEGKAVGAAADSAMLDMLAHNEDYTKLQRHIAGLDVPHKTGDTDQVRTECALFPLQSRVVACVLTKENVDQRYLIDNEAQVMMARMGEAIAGAWPRRPPVPAAR
ncbi:MAG: class A beta-lactamase-related serine hydrolase [Gemmatimonadaceae bacterium]|nr:class A beta-lactamase-related serine hydrolase [Gemmatimonadaceae bacterium]